jgi:hypothetical protein
MIPKVTGWLNNVNIQCKFNNVNVWVALVMLVCTMAVKRDTVRIEILTRRTVTAIDLRLHSPLQPIHQHAIMNWILPTVSGRNNLKHTLLCAHNFATAPVPFATYLNPFELDQIWPVLSLSIPSAGPALLMFSSLIWLHSEFYFSSESLLLILRWEHTTPILYFLYQVCSNMSKFRRETPTSIPDVETLDSLLGISCPRKKHMRPLQVLSGAEKERVGLITLEKRQEEIDCDPEGLVSTIGLWYLRIFHLLYTD